MHEHSLMVALMERIRAIAAREGASRVTRVSVWLGALSHMSEEHFREHFAAVAPGSPAAGADLEVTVSDDPRDANAQHILIQSVDVDVETGPA